MPEWILVLAGGVVGIAGTLVSTILMMRHQSNESYKEDLRTIRDERAKRMRQALVPIIAASYALWDVVIDASLKPNEIDSAEYQARLDRYLDDANLAISELSLERGGRPYLDGFQNLSSHVRKYRQQLDLIRSNEGGASREKLREHRKNASSTLEGMRDKAEAELALLEEAI